MIPVLFGLGGLVAKAAAAATLIKTAVCALKAAVPPVSESVRPTEKSLYGQKQLTEHNKRYFGQGEVQGVTKLFYTFDHLGSVRELVDDAGTVQAQYRYSTYGERTKETGNLESDWGYAGLWHHQASGLDLATYRLYDAANKRWISRDPLGEGVDYNLYRYCGNAPIGKNDPAGLQPGAFVLTVNSARIDIDRNLIVDANLSILATPNRPIASPTVTVKVSVRRCGQWSVEYLKIHDYRSLADIGRQVLYPKNIEFPLNLSGDKWKDAEAIEVEMWADAVDVFLTPLGTRRFRKFFEF